VLNQSKLGPILVFIGIFVGGPFWLFACVLRFDIDDVINYGDPGEAIWAIDPVFTILAALPGLVLFLKGFVIAIFPITSESDTSVVQLDSKNHNQLNLLYIGEIFLLVTVIIGWITFFLTFNSIHDRDLFASVIFALITATCGFNLLNILYYTWRGHPETGMISRVIRNTNLLLVLEFVVLIVVVLTFQLYTSWLIRLTTIFLLLFGCFGVFLIFLSASIMKNKYGAEGEI